MLGLGRRHHHAPPCDPPTDVALVHLDDRRPPASLIRLTLALDERGIRARVVHRLRRRSLRDVELLMCTARDAGAVARAVERRQIPIVIADLTGEPGDLADDLVAATSAGAGPAGDT